MNWQYQEGKLLINGQVQEPSSKRTLDEMRDVLQNPEAIGPDVIYTVYRDVPDEGKPEGMRADVTVISPGKLGQEYHKTYGHYHQGEGVETYKLLSGEGVILIQKPDFNLENIEAVRLVKLPPNQLIDIPSGWGHVLVNTGSSELITVNYLSPETENIYSTYEKKHGAAYYIIENDGKAEPEVNSNYQNIPEPQAF